MSTSHALGGRADGAEAAADPLDRLAEACAIDPGAAFAPPVLARLAALKKEHRVRFELHKAATLYAKEAPAFGGDTAFANQYLACASLSPGMRELLDGMQAKHTSAMPYGGESARFASVSRLVSPSPEDRKFRASLYDKSADVVPITNLHPVVRTHPETGKRCLYVNRGFTSRFRNMTPEESRPLLEFLWDHACRMEFTCRYRWSQDDIAVWDNRCVLYYALNDYAGYRREMHRISVHEPTRPA